MINKKTGISIVTLAALAATLLLATSASAQVPLSLTQQGRLFDANDVPIDATLSVTFSVYDNANDNTAAWSETHSIQFVSGYFSVILGGTTTLDGVFDGAVKYLGVTVASDPEMTPRAAIHSVPYAIMADNATGDITPNSVTIPGYGAVIDSSGQWVGDPTGLVGPTGPAGPTGATGPAGPTGPTGAIGATGPQGATGAMGPQGPQGAQGPQGPQGPQGQTGPQGAQGPQGPQGAQGPQGPAGATGPAGPIGPAGPTGVVSMVAVAGSGTLPNTLTANTIGFVGVTASVTVAAGQRVHVVATKYMGGTAAASGLDLYPCYRASGSTAAPTTYGGGMWGGSMAAAGRQSWSVNGVFQGLSGTYTVGMCASIANPALWNNSEWGYVSAIVANY